jgi:alpha-glucosidase
MSLQPVVYTETLPVDADINVVLTYNEGNGYDARLFGKKEIFHRCRTLTPEFKQEQCLNGESYIMLPEGYLKVSQCANFILENPQGIDGYLNDFDTAYAALPEIIAKHKYSGDKFRKRLAAQLEFSK